MKICFITDTVFSLGGIQRVLSVLASSLSEYHDIEIICTKDSFKIDRSLYNLSKNVKINIEPTLGKSNNNIFEKAIFKIIRRVNNRTNIPIPERFLLESYYNKKIRSRFIEYLNKQDYDVIVGVDGIYSIIIASISEYLKAKTIGWHHNSYDAHFNNPNQYFWKQDKIFRKYLNNLNYTVVLTESDKKKYREKLNINNCINIYNPLSFESEKKSNCLNKNILFVGRLVEYQKGLDILIDVFEKVNEKRPDWNLYIVGDGDDKDKLIYRIKEKMLEDKVKICSHTNNILNYYANSSIFVSTSRWEGFGLVITEAMECGVPVISFDNTGPSEIIDNNLNGIIIEKGNVDMMVENIIYMIDNPEIRKSISKEAVKRAENFKIDTIVRVWNEKLESIYA